MRHKALRYTIVGLELFVVVMAIYGSISMRVDAAGFGLKEGWLHGSPFTNYQIPAIGLLVGVGGSSLLAAASLVRALIPWGVLLSILAGVILVVFELVETYSIGLRNFQQPLMFVIGFLIAGLAIVLWQAEKLAATASSSSPLSIQSAG